MVELYVEPTYQHVFFITGLLKSESCVNISVLNRDTVTSLIRKIWPLLNLCLFFDYGRNMFLSLFLSLSLILFEGLVPQIDRHGVCILIGS